MTQHGHIYLYDGTDDNKHIKLHLSTCLEMIHELAWNQGKAQWAEAEIYPISPYAQTI